MIINYGNGYMSPYSIRIPSKIMSKTSKTTPLVENGTNRPKQFGFIILCCWLTILPTMVTAKNKVESLSIQDFKFLSTVIANVKQYYYKPIDTKTLFVNALSGMLSGLDPHSSYLGADDLKDLELITTGEFGGIGVEIIPDQGLIKIISPIDDTPAYKTGIKAGDLIIQINGNLVKDMSLRDAVKHMRGPKNSILNLTILRKNHQKPLTFSIKRDVIKIKGVKERLLEKNYGYIRIAIFQEITDRDLTRAVNKLEKLCHGQIKGLILDLRNNPGGLLYSAIQVADSFLDADKLRNDIIVSTKGQSEDFKFTARMTAGELLPDVPIAILINEGSASASEVVAGALQDHKRAIVVGTKSFGKGSVQTVIPLTDDSAIKLTTALYYTPDGRSIQAKGIEPDIVVENMQITKQKDTDADLLHIDESNFIDHIKSDGKSDPHKHSTSKKNLIPSNHEQSLAHEDYQLYEALHILKSINVMQH